MAYKIRLNETYNRRPIRDKKFQPVIKDTDTAWASYRAVSSIASNANGYVRKYRFSEVKGHWLTDGWRVPISL